MYLTPSLIDAAAASESAPAAEPMSIWNDDGFYVKNGQDGSVPYNSLTKDGLWVGKGENDEGFHVDNSGNISTDGMLDVNANTDTGMGLRVHGDKIHAGSSTSDLQITSNQAVLFSQNQNSKTWGYAGAMAGYGALGGGVTYGEDGNVVSQKSMIVASDTEALMQYIVDADSKNYNQISITESGTTITGDLTVDSQIHGVQAGSADTDAVNMSQLNSKADKTTVDTKFDALDKAGIKAGDTKKPDDTYAAGAVAMGTDVHANGDDAIAIGSRVNNTLENDQKVGSGSIAIGSQTSVIFDGTGNGGAGNIAIGADARATGGYGSLALGKGAQSTHFSAIAFGEGARASGNSSLALGYYANANAEHAVAIGHGVNQNSSNNDFSYTAGAYSVVIGDTARAAVKNGTALGAKAEVKSGEGGLALGTSSYVNEGTQGKGSVALGRNSWVIEADIDKSDTYGVVSVGSSSSYGSFQRRIINVADPINDHDAATKGWVEKNFAAKSSASSYSLSGNTLSSADGTVSIDLAKASDMIKAAEAWQSQQSAKQAITALSLQGAVPLSMKADSMAGTDSTEGGRGPNSDTPSNGSWTTGEDGGLTTDKNVTIGGELTVNGAAHLKDTTVTGTLTIQDDNGKTINVADELSSMSSAVQDNRSAISSLGRSVSKLGDEIDSVGAISAALAGLHPIDYYGDESKYQIAAALGTYDGTQAVALGGFYHVSDNVLLSLGVSSSLEGERKTAGNIGATFRVGPGSSSPYRSRAAVAKELTAVKAENEAQKEMLKEQQAQIDELKAKLDALLADKS